jgi:mannose-6-phosphate isomerase-like protein (cupin superfamily)
MPKIARLRRATYFADRKAQVAVRREPVQHDVGEHGHEFLEIVIVLSGSGVHVTHGVRQKLASGDVLVINSSRSHAYETTHSLNLVNILVHEGIFEQTEKQLGTLPGYHALFTLEPVRWRQRKFTSHLRLKPEDLKLAVSWIEALEAESRLKSEGSLLLVRSWMILLIGLLARQYGKKTPHGGALGPDPLPYRAGRL